MTTHDIKPNPKAVNWIRTEEVGGYVSIKRIGDQGEVLQSFMVFPEEVEKLVAVLSKKGVAA